MKRTYITALVTIVICAQVAHLLPLYADDGYYTAYDQDDLYSPEELSRYEELSPRIKDAVRGLFEKEQRSYDKRVPLERMHGLIRGLANSKRVFHGVGR